MKRFKMFGFETTTFRFETFMQVPPDPDNNRQGQGTKGRWTKRPRDKMAEGQSGRGTKQPRDKTAKVPNGRSGQKREGRQKGQITPRGKEAKRFKRTKMSRGQNVKRIGRPYGRRSKGPPPPPAPPIPASHLSAHPSRLRRFGRTMRNAL